MGNRKKIAAIVFGLAVAAVLMALSVNKPPNPDQAIFDYIGWIGINGGTYYTDVAEQNFPGEMLLHEWAFRIFGVHIWSYRALDFIIAALGAASLGGILAFGHYGFGALAGAGFYLVGYISSNGWMSGQRDAVAANLLLIGGYFFLRRLRGGTRFWIVPLAAVAFFSMLLRPTYLLFIAFLPVLDILLRDRHARKLPTCLIDSGLVVSLFVVMAGAMLGFGAAAGALPDFWEQVFLFNTQSYQAGHSYGDTLARIGAGLWGYAAFVPAALWAVAKTRKDHDRTVPLLFVCGFFALAVVSSFVQNKGFGYHLAAVMPPLFGLSGIAITEFIKPLIGGAWRPLHRHAAAGIVSLLCIAGLGLQFRSMAPQLRYLLGIESYRQMAAREGAGGEGLTWADLHDAADHVRAETRADETVLVWGRPVSINLLAARKSPTRFITHGMLLLAGPSFERSRAWIDEFAQALEKAPPRFIFYQDEEPPLDTSAWAEADPGSTAAGVLADALAARYSFVRSFGSLKLFKRADQL